MEQEYFYEWSLGSELWVQSSESQLFMPAAKRASRLEGESSWPVADSARHLGCKAPGAGCGKGPLACGWFPAVFDYCPECGARLMSPAPSDLHAWLPPFGNEPGRQEEKNFSGLRLTHRKLCLERSAEGGGKPDASLPRPPTGDFQFLVAALGTKAAALIAVAPGEGKLYAFSPSSQQWVKVFAKDENFLEGWSLPTDLWTVAASSLDDGGHVWVPTNSGLCKLELDPVALRFRAEYRETGACVGAPVALGASVLVPCVNGDGAVELVAAPASGDGPSVHLPVEGMPTGSHWFRSAIGDARKAVWECEAGQVLVRMSPGGGYKAMFLAWPEGLLPLFDLGSPYCDRSGKLWRQCSNDTSGRIEYVELYNAVPDRHEADGPRTGTGGLSFRLGAVILEKDNPWDEVFIEPRHESRVLYPLVECDSDDVAVCVAIESARPVAQLLRSGERLRGGFVLRGSIERDFFNFELTQPWQTRVFVYEGHLYLYHAGWDRIFGWRLAT